MDWSVYGINGYRTEGKPVRGEIIRPQGFIVNEVQGDYGNGDYTHFTLKKNNWTTTRALEFIAKKLNVRVTRFSYAGNKDKNAVTTQLVSAFKVPEKKLLDIQIKGIEILNITEGKDRVSLGSHKGNEFIITLSNAQGTDNFNEFRAQAMNGLPNFFGPQRFGEARPNTHLIGKALLDRNYLTALKILLCQEGDGVSARQWLNDNWGDWGGALSKFPRFLSIERGVINYLRNHPEDYVSALKQPHKMIRLLWINAWQSYEWNNELSKDLMNPPESIPIKPHPQIPEMPELHDFKGGLRNSLMNLNNLKGELVGGDFKLSFTLGKGEYATVLLRELMK